MQDYMQALVNTLNNNSVNVAGETAVETVHPYIDANLVSVYRNNSATAFADVLRANFKTVEALVGREYFSALTLNYMQEYPCQNRTLVGYGSEFTTVLENNISNHKLPYLTSFSKLDRAWTQAHIAPDTQTLTLEELVNSLGPEGDLLAQTITFKPDVCIVKNQWPVYHIWASLRDGHELGETIKLEEKQENILMWRYENEVIHKPLNQGEFIFLEALFAQHTLGKASEITLAYHPEMDINQMLMGMINAGLFTTFIGENNG